MFDLIYPTPAGLDKLKGKNQPATPPASHDPPNLQTWLAGKTTAFRTFGRDPLGKARPSERPAAAG